MKKSELCLNMISDKDREKRKGLTKDIKEVKNSRNKSQRSSQSNSI